MENIKIACLMGALLLTACGDDNDNKQASDDKDTPITIPDDKDTPIAVPVTYTFASQIEAGEDAVSYTGQTARNVMISDLKSLISSDDLLNSGTPEDDLLTAFGANGDDSLDAVDHGQTAKGGFSAIPGPTYGDISTGKTLVGKIAGNDKCTGVNGRLIGQTEGIDTDVADLFIAAGCEETATQKGHAQQLVEHYFSQITALIETPAVIATSEDPTYSLPHYIDAQGRDYQQLTQKFLTMSITFNQGTNDYLVGALSASHEADKGTKPYSTAEHKWDEGFGYFGAARDYNTAYTDATIKAGEVVDTNNDGQADLRSEVNMNNAVNCAKRDAANLGTDYTKIAFEAFVEGRTLLNRLAKAQAQADTEAGQAAFEALKAESADALAEQAEIAANTWEKCVAATVVHYINDSIADIDAVLEADDTTQFKNGQAFKDYAKHWSELKGFALGLQYNPKSPINNGKLDDYTNAMALVGDAPKLPQEGEEAFSAYKTSLLEARDLFQAIYGFTDEQAEKW